MSTNAAERSRCLVVATGSEIFNEIDELFMMDRRLKVREVIRAVGNSCERGT